MYTRRRSTSRRWLGLAAGLLAITSTTWLGLGCDDDGESVSAADRPTPSTRADKAAHADKPSATQQGVADKTPAAGSAVDDRLPPIEGAALIDAIRKSGRKGTLVSVWASWCGSCKHDLPMMVGLTKALESEGIGLVLVSADEPSGRAAAIAFLDKLSVKPKSFIVQGDMGAFKHALNPAWKGALPSTFLYDAEGKLRFFWPGPASERELEDVVGAFLAGRPFDQPMLVEPGPRHG